jgi:hypothetical protein
MKATRRHGCELAVCLDCRRGFAFGFQKALLAQHAEAQPGHRCFDFDAHFYGWNIESEDFSALLKPRLEALFEGLQEEAGFTSNLPERYFA